MRICIDDCVVQFSVITKEWSSDSISLQDLLIGFMVMWLWFEHKISFNLVEGWIEDCWNRITMNLWLWACLEILCSSRYSCVLRLRRFVVEVLRCFRGLNPLSFTDLWFDDVFRHVWLDSRKLCLGRWSRWFCSECSPISGLKFLKALRLDLHKAFSLLNSGPPKCLKKASIYRSLGVGERHVAELDWWHMSQPDWSA